jgi:hypothetical protein
MISDSGAASQPPASTVSLVGKIRLAAAGAPLRRCQLETRWLPGGSSVYNR